MMLSVEASAASVRFDGELPEGTTAFVDADWVPVRGADVVAPLLWHAGELRRDEKTARVPAETTPRSAAAGVLELVAREAVEHLRPLPRDAVGISGDGLTARLAAGLLGPRHPARKRFERPLGWIEFSGELEQIVAATAAVADLGTVVLAGESGDDPGPFDFYPDAHLRSLRIVGVAPVLAREPRTAPMAVAIQPAVASLGNTTARAEWFEIRDR